MNSVLPQVGDNVEFTFKNVIHKGKVVQVSSNVVNISEENLGDYHITLINGDWYINGEDGDEIIDPEFTQSIFLTERGNNVYEKVFLLARLPHTEFVNMCEVNREMRSICTKYVLNGTDNITERLYREHCEYLFPKEVIALKPEDMTWKNFYERINYYTYEVGNYEPSPQINATQGLYSDEMLDDRVMFQEAIEYGDIVGIKYIIYRYPNYSYLNDPLVRNNIRGLLDATAGRGNLDVLKFFSEFNIFPEYLDRAIINNQLKVVKWLHSQGIVNIDTLNYVLKTIKRKGLIQMLEFLYENFPEVSTSSALYFGQAPPAVEAWIQSKMCGARSTLQGLPQN